MRRLCLACLCTLALACGETDEGDTAAADSSSSGTSATTTGSESTGGASTDTPASTTTDDDEGSTSDTPSSTGQSADTGTSDGGDETSGSTGDALPRGQWAVTEITYTEGGTSETLTMQDRAFCDATLSGEGLLLRYQQADGYTVWTVTIPTATSAGSHALTQDFSGVYMNINEVSDTWQAYFDPSMAFGTLVLSEANVSAGGLVSGTLTATLTSVDDSTTAAFESAFYAEIP